MTIAFLDDRAVLRIAGADSRGFLQGLLTNDLDMLAPDRPLYAGLLSPQGKALFDMILFDAEGGVLVDVAATRAETLARRLGMYRLRKAVTIEATDLKVMASWNESTTQKPDPRFAPLGQRWIAEAGGVPGAALYDAHRLAIGVPDSVDIGSDELLWLETGADLLHGVSFTKGCYVGQENTARMHHRDKVRRRLVPVTFGGAAATGAIINDAAGRAAGTLRSQRGPADTVDGTGIAGAANNAVIADNAGIAHLRLEAAAGPLTLDAGPLTVQRPSWVEPALAAAVSPA